MVSSRQTPASATPDEFHPSAGILHDRDPVANDQASADRHLEMVQRIRLGGFLAVRHSDDEDVSWVESAADANRARYPANLLQLYNAALLGAFWPFFTGVVVQLLTGILQFARMILLRPE